MKTSWIREAPAATEYATYYHTYVSKVPSGDVLQLLEDEMDDTLELFRALNEEQGTHRYAEGKWSIKEVFGHLIDAERVFALRCLAFARAEKNALPPFDENEYVATTSFNNRSFSNLTEEFEHLRRSNIALFRSLTDDEMDRKGVASGVEFTARSIPYIMVGHEIHHKRVLRERYLS